MGSADIPSVPLVYTFEDELRARQLAARLGLQLVDQPPLAAHCLYLFYRDGALYLGRGAAAREHPICVDFAEQQRSRHPGKELLLKAIGGRRPGLSVVDATAGLGRDAFLLASYGAQVLMCERQPAVAALLEDGLQRGQGQAEVADIAWRMRLHQGAALAYLRGLTVAEHPDVVYLDPMFPESGKTALVKKEMRLFHDLVGADEDAGALLEQALQTARHRVVVKRPPQASPLAMRAPQFCVSGKAVRFDIYPLKAFDKR